LIMPNLYRYRVWCNTDSQWEYNWREESEGPQTTCPVNTAHPIDASKTSYVETVLDAQVEIKEENISGSGKYQANGWKMSIIVDPVNWQSKDISFPFDIYLYSAEFQTSTNQNGDEIAFWIGPDTNLGDITADIAIGNTVINVPQSTIDNAKIGGVVKVNDGVNINDMGRILLIDKDNKKLTMETAATNIFLSATPTKIEHTLQMIRSYFVDNDHRYQFGLSKIGGSRIPANTILQARYLNNAGGSKTFRFGFEYTIKQ